MTRADLLARMDSREITDWLALDRLDGKVRDLVEDSKGTITPEVARTMIWRDAEED